MKRLIAILSMLVIVAFVGCDMAQAAGPPMSAEPLSTNFSTDPAGPALVALGHKDQSALAGSSYRFCPNVVTVPGGHQFNVICPDNQADKVIRFCDHVQDPARVAIGANYCANYCGRRPRDAVIVSRRNAYYYPC